MTEIFPRSYGKFELLERLGRGGMAETFRARMAGAAGFSKIVVIKRILPEYASDTRMLEMFVNEANLVSRIQHPNVVQVFDLGQTSDGEYYMAMEYVPGVDLGILMKRAQLHQVNPPLWFWIHAMHDVLAGLSVAHEHRDEDARLLPVIHRDVTPGNILLSVNGEIKLSDFGIAKPMGQKQSEQDTELTGKVAYMSPEMLQGEGLDPRSDLFSAGVILWECLAGRPLFWGHADFEVMMAICKGPREPPSTYNSAVSPELDGIALRALEPDRTNRFASAREFATSLARVLAATKPELSHDEVRHVANVLIGEEEPTPSFGLSAVDVSNVPAAPNVIGGPVPGAPVRPSNPAPPLVPPTIRGTPLPETMVNDGPEPIEMAHPEPLMKIPNASTAQMATSTLADLMDRTAHSATSELEAVTDSAARYAGPHPFYVTARSGRRDGPLGYDDLFQRVRQLEDPVETLSGDNNDWLDRRTFALLAGLPILAPPHPSNQEVSFSGNLDQTSPMAVLGHLGLKGATGRLHVLLMTEGALREIDFVNGRPTYVMTEVPELQAPVILARAGLIRPEAVVTFVHRVLREQKSLEQLVFEDHRIDGPTQQSLVLRESLAEFLRWTSGHYAFDMSSEPRSQKAGSASLSFLFAETVRRAFTKDELLAKLAPYMDQRFEAHAQLGSLLAQLSLTEPQKQALDTLIRGQTLGAVLRTFPSAGAHPLGAIVYMLLEIGMIRALR